MRTYQIHLSSDSVLTQIPDSQKLFGALMYLYSDTFGQEHATSFAQALLHNQITYMLSSVMPKGYLPVPQDYLIDNLSDKTNDEWSDKEKRKRIKARNYLKYSDLEQILKDPEKAVNVFPYVKLNSYQNLRASIESTRYDIPGLESNLYSVPTAVPLEITKEKNLEKSLIRDFCFYLMIDDSGIVEEFFKVVALAVEKKRTLVLGKRSSQGMNLFKLMDCQVNSHLNDSHSNCFLNTGMLLPNEIDYQKSTIKLFTSERRPFEIVGGWSDRVQGQFISFIAEGSLISSSNGIRTIGKSIASPFDREAIIFGNAFQYPLPNQERGCV